MKKLLEKIRRILRNRRTRQLLTRAVSITAAVVVFITTYALVLPAITMETTAFCGVEEHEHTDDCYTEELICGLDESPGHRHDESCYAVSRVQVCEEEEHQHTGACYDQEGKLVCEEKEHQHTDECFKEEKELICGIPESEGHTHTEECYRKTLTCGKEVHIHSVECYEDPEADNAVEVFGASESFEDVSEDEFGSLEDDAAFDTDGYDPDSESDWEDDDDFLADDGTDPDMEISEDAASNLIDEEFEDDDELMTEEVDDSDSDFSDSDEENAYDEAGEEAGDELAEEAGEEIEEETDEGTGEEFAEETGEEFVEEDEEADDETGEEFAEEAEEELAEEADEETGEEFAEEAGEETGEEFAEEAGEETGEELGEEAGEETGEGAEEGTNDAAEAETGEEIIEGLSEGNGAENIDDESLEEAEGTKEGTEPAEGDAQTAEEEADSGSTDAEASAVDEKSYVPELEQVNFDTVLSKETGIYYYHVSEEETLEDSSAVTEWKKVEEDTELGKRDLLRVYLAYTIPGGSLNETNQTARYRLPDKICLSQEQIEAIGKSENGITAAYSDSEEDYQKYLGAEAVEGSRKPDEQLQEDDREFISATVRAENVFDEEDDDGDEGTYLGQDLVFTFVPYTIEKNRNIYDAEQNIVSAGEEITGWFVCDLNMDQVEWGEETVISETLIDPEAEEDDQQAQEDLQEDSEDSRKVQADLQDNSEDNRENGEALRDNIEDEQQAQAENQENGEALQDNSGDNQENGEALQDNSEDDQQASKDNQQPQDAIQDNSEDRQQAREENQGDGEVLQDDSEDELTIREDAPDKAGDDTGDDSDRNRRRRIVLERTAEIIFVAENKEEEIEEISSRLRLAEEIEIETEETVEEDTDPGEEEAEDASAAGSEEVETEDTDAEKEAEQDAEEVTAGEEGKTAEDTAEAGKDADGANAAGKDKDAADPAVDKADTAAETGKETGDQTKQETKEAKEFKSGTLTADGDGYRITLDYTAEAQIPDDAELSVREITAETDQEAYEQCLAQAKAHVGKAGQEKADVDASLSRFFDIEILSGDVGGEEDRDTADGTETDPGEDDTGTGVTMRKIEPAAPVKVSIEILDVPETASGQKQQSEPTVLHFAEQGVEQIDAAATIEEAEADADSVEDDSADGIEEDGKKSGKGSGKKSGKETKEAGKEIRKKSGKQSGKEAAGASGVSVTDTRSSSGSDKAAKGRKKRKTLEVQFEAESFSIYGIVYTVDFYWEVNGKTYQFTLPGGGYVSFEALMEVLGVAVTDPENSDLENPDELQAEENPEDADELKSEENPEDEPAEVLTINDVEISEETRTFVADVTNVEFSKPELVWIGKAAVNTTVGDLKESNELEVQYSDALTEEQIAEINAQSVEAGDWALISVLPFATEESLTVTMKTGEVFTIRVTDDGATTNPQYTKISRSDMNVNNRDDGIIIKLFDYSGTVNYQYNDRNIDSVWGANTNSNSLRGGTGVNNGRTLVFSGSGLENQEWYNNFTGTKGNMDFYSGYRRAEIVKHELVNGYPELNDNITRYGRDDGNLDYLFKSGEQSGVTEYSAGGQGLQGLLRKDADGYYYYSSEDNYARYDDNGYIDLYTDTYYKDKGAQAAANNGFGSIGFFPFTNYSPSHKEEKGPNDTYYNHQLGMSMQAYFTYPPDGTIKGHPMTFEFSGDDDVWVYVDGKLALDLGGVHQPIKGVIDFENKEVRYYEYEAYNTSDTPKVEIITTVPFSDIFGEDGFDDSDYSTHKLDFFFLERGGCDSNCALKFNLQTLTTAEKEFTKVNDGGSGLPGAEFTIYTDEECTQPLSVNNAPLKATSDANGKVSFSNIPVRKNSDDVPIVYYMKETKSPGGYVRSNVTYKLVYNNSTKTYGVFTLDNQTSEQIVNTPVHPIELGVEKQWQDAEGNVITPGNDYSATFVVQRLESHIDPPVASETTVRIGYVDDSNGGWTLRVLENRSFKRGTEFSISYRYTNSNAPKKQMYQPQNASYQYPGFGNTEGTFNYTVPNSGTYDIYFYNQGGGDNAVSWTLEGEEQNIESEPTEFAPDDSFNNGEAYKLILSNGALQGTFNGPVSGKFPVQEVINGVTYSYKYYITETERTPNNNEAIFVDADGKVISDPAAHYLEDDTMQTVINRELLNIPFEKYWAFDSDASADAYTWTATMQLESRLVDKQTGEAVTAFEPVEGRQLTVTSEGNGQGSFDGLPMFGAQNGIEYRIQYSESEIAYEVRRVSDNVVVAQWQDPDYYEHPVEQIGEKKYTLHYIQDAGENGDSIDDYSLIVNNTPENRIRTKEIEVSLRKTWPAEVDLSSAHADFVLKRYIYEEYRNFPSDTTEWVEITLDTGNGSPQKLRVAKDWEMTIFGNIKNHTNAVNIEFSDGSKPSGVPLFSYDNSAEDKEYTFAIRFVADRTKTVTLVNGSQYVAGGKDGFRLTDINDPGDMVIKLDKGFELPLNLSSENSWQQALHSLPAIEEDTQYDVENPLEITRHIYRYFLEEVDCSPEDYFAVFKDNSGNVFGDIGNRIDNNTTITAENNPKPGSIKITKTVKVNNDDPTSVTAALVDGEYSFTIAGISGTPTEGETKTATVRISGGQANTVEVDGLKPGQYTVTEQTPENGTSLVGENGLTVTVESGKTGDAVSGEATAGFTNNIDVTDLTFAKAWKQEDKTTDLEGREDQIITFTLMQVAETVEGETIRNDIYEGAYILNNIKHTATAESPCIMYVSQNEPFTIAGLPTSGAVNVNGESIPVTFTYYAVETEIEGFVGDVSDPIDYGTYTITNSEIPETSRSTDVTIEKEWSGTNADKIGGVKVKLIQEKAELTGEGTGAFYPFIIYLRDDDGVIRNEKVVFVKHGTWLNIPVEKVSSGLAGTVWQGMTPGGNGHVFRVENITSSDSTTLTIRSLLGDYKWGTNWRLGELSVYNNRGAVSETPDAFIDELNEDPSTMLDYSSTGVEIIVNMPAKGTSFVTGNAYETTDYPGEWKTTVNELPLYEPGEDGKYYAYRYRVKELSIIDPRTREDIETFVQNPDGTGGESTHFIAEYNNDSDPLKVTNTKRPDTQITLKKVDEKDVYKANLSNEDLLDGAKFKITKYKKLDPLELDEDWNRDHSAESTGEDGIFTFTGLTAGIYMIEETQYPDGYSKLEEPPFLRVNDDLSIQLIDSSGNPIEGNQTDLIRFDGETTIVYGNTPGAALPHTGGHGTSIFSLFGSMLILGAAFLLWKRRREI